MFAPWRLPTLVSRPWRLVPELDAYSDRRCASYAAPLTRDRLLGLLVAGVTTFLVGVPMAFLASFIAEHLIEPLLPAVRDPNSVASRITWVVFAVTVIGITLWIALTPYVLLVRRGLLRRLCRAACPFCGYSLLGLPVRDGAATCPECGREVVLADHALSEQDLLTGAVAEDRTDGAPSPTIQLITRLGHAAGAAALGMWIVFGWPLLLVGVALGYPAFLLAISHLHGLVRRRAT